MTQQQDVRRVTWTQAGAQGRTVFVVAIVVDGVEKHKVTRFDRDEAETAAEGWARWNGYTITHRQAGEAIPR